ncbi:hypothetical protein [Levilactobacillus brevis]|uniref:hypothetical protein n=1 Tax=Levilactobacillus brevis TaxID=1580 RepID=UPI001BABC767|nr:hypothetical protein [Levilactobacillus brevis]MBS0977494.1 hypothetical protein [Levilactobacillus brevis]
MEAIGAIIAAIITSVIIAPIITNRKIDAEFHNTINWRQELYNVSIKQFISLSDVIKLQALISPIKEDEEDKAIYNFCSDLIDNATTIDDLTSKKIRKISQLLLKLNWLKHGSGRKPLEALHLHFFPFHAQNLIFTLQIHMLIEQEIKGTPIYDIKVWTLLSKNWLNVSKVVLTNTVLSMLYIFVGYYIYNAELILKFPLINDTWQSIFFLFVSSFFISTTSYCIDFWVSKRKLPYKEIVVSEKE